MIVNGITPDVTGINSSAGALSGISIVAPEFEMARRVEFVL
jgi:hypothetical protein